MGFFDIFKKKDKPIQDIPYRFNFDKAPELLEVYKEYRSLKLEAVALSRKNSSNERMFDLFCFCLKNICMWIEIICYYI